MTIAIPLVNFDIGHCQNSLAGVYIMFGYPVTSISVEGTDIAKITRKWSKPDKHGHGKGKRIQEPGECYQRECHVDCEKTHKDARFYTKRLGKEAQVSHHGLPRWQSVCSLNDLRAKIRKPMIEKNEGEGLIGAST
ncbi:hypothetical protein Tco_0328564 [Tanacetum coccineum]